MALVLKDRVREVSTTAGTGTITLSGAVSGYQPFSVVGDGNVTYYTIYDSITGDWEVGYGTYTSAGNMLSRTFVYDSSNAGALVSFSSNAKDVFCTYPAEQAIYQETNGNLKLVGGVIGLTQDGTEGTTLPNTSFQAFTTGNYYMQANQQNLSSGAQASADWVITADNGTDTEFYIDLGMGSSGYNYPDYSAIKANTGYLLSTGADLRFIAGKFGAVTPGAQDIVFIAGSLKDTEERLRIKGATGNVILDGANPTDTGEKLQVVGTAKITGATTFGSTVTLNANPNNPLEAATKQYVDSAAATGFTVHTAVRLTTAAALPSNTYNNGASGVGATLTATANGALSVDGVAVAVSDRILVKNEATSAYNGAYVVTQTGNGSTPYILTRATDFDQAAAGEIANNAYFFTTAGSTNAGSSFVLSQTAAITVGTTALPFTLFADQLDYVGGTNINVTGTTISLTGTVATTNGGTGLNTYTTGDILYSNASNSLAALPLGSSGQVLIVSGSTPAWGAVDLDNVGTVSGVLPTHHGGTGIDNYATGDLLYASATNTLAKLTGNTTTTKNFLTQTGTGSASQAPAWGTISAADVSGLAASATTDTTNAANISTGALPSGRLSGGYTGITGVGTLTLGTWQADTIAAAYGGTGFTSYTVGDLLYANTSSTLAKLSDVATGNALLSGGVGVAPSWGKIDLGTTVTGTLPVANGGTGATTLTANGVVLGNGTAALQTVVGTGAGQVLTWNGTTWTAAAASSGVTSITGTANQVIASASTGAVTLSLPQSIATTSGPQFGSLGVGTAASGVTGEIRATNNVTAYYSSDARLKQNIRDIPDALDKALAIGGKLFDWTDDYIAQRGGEDGYFVRRADFGVIAQDVQAHLPEAVRAREDGMLAVDYEKLCALAFAAIKELNAKVEALQRQ